jgi:hypothetical protein
MKTSSAYVSSYEENTVLQQIAEKQTALALRVEVFTAVTMKNAVFWDITPCGSCKNSRFGGTYRLVIRVT